MIVLKHDGRLSSPLPKPGFNVIYLPYADDVRTLDLPQNPSASQEQVDKMKEIVTKLRFKYRFLNLCASL